MPDPMFGRGVDSRTENRLVREPGGAQVFEVPRVRKAHAAVSSDMLSESWSIGSSPSPTCCWSKLTSFSHVLGVGFVVASAQDLFLLLPEPLLLFWAGLPQEDAPGEGVLPFGIRLGDFLDRLPDRLFVV